VNLIRIVSASILHRACHVCKNSLVGLGGILEGAENVWVGTTFDAVDEVADFTEEGVVVGESVCNACRQDWSRQCSNARVWDLRRSSMSSPGRRK
jgi:hypothetical protein